MHLVNSHDKEFKTKNERDLFAIKHRIGITEKHINSIVSDYKDGVSALEIKHKYQIPYKVVQSILSAKNIIIRNERDAAATKTVREKYKKTCKEKYGVENVSQSEAIKNQKIMTFQEHYGVDNIFSTPDFPEYVSNIMLERYGQKRRTNGAKISEIRLAFSSDKKAQILHKFLRTRLGWDDDHKKDYSKQRSEIAKQAWVNLSEHERQIRIKKWLDNLSKNGYHSALESKIAGVLTSCNIPYVYQFWLKGTYYDFLIWNSLILEINGDYWHANPTKYNASDIMVFPNRKIAASRIWKKDSNKLNKAVRSGYKLLTLWETDINQAEKNKNLQQWLLGSISENIKN